MTGDELTATGATAASGAATAELVAELLPTLRAFAIPMPVKFRGTTLRQGALLHGPAGWGEFSPFPEYGPRECARWLACAQESAAHWLASAARAVQRAGERDGAGRWPRASTRDRHPLRLPDRQGQGRRAWSAGVRRHREG